jgi:hypothetical protein
VRAATIFVAMLIGNMTCATAWGQFHQEQEVYAKHAKVAFQEYSADEQKSGIKPFTSDYQSHYNTKLDKCLIRIEETIPSDGEFITNVLLFEVFERRLYASYFSKSGSKVLTYCDLIPTFHDEKTFCSSRGEFDSFVSKYMEQ